MTDSVNQCDGQTVAVPRTCATKSLCSVSYLLLRSACRSAASLRALLVNLVPSLRVSSVMYLQDRHRPTDTHRSL